MFGSKNERYGPYPKKKGKRRAQVKEGRSLNKTYEWVKWRLDRIGQATIYHPCLEH
jgi:hypothetical protein